MQNTSSENNSTEFLPIEYPRVPLVYLLLFCGYIIIWYLQIGYRWPKFGAIRIELLWALLLIALSFTMRTSFMSPLLKYLGFFFLTLIIQVPLSHNFDHSWEIFVDRVIKFAFMSYFIIVFVKSPRDLKFFIAAFLLACFKMGQEGVTGVLSGNLVWENQGVMRLHGSTPNYAHPNSFSGMAMGTLPFAYYLFPVVNKYVKIILLLLFGFATNIVLYTGSRTGYVAFVIFWLFVIYKSEYRKRLVLLVIPMLIMTIFIIPKQYQERFTTIYTGQAKEGHSEEKRIQILKDAIQVFAIYPLGVGVSAFPKVRMDMFDRSQDTHNLYLEVATNLGIQGFIAFFLFVFMMLCMLNRMQQEFDRKILMLYQIKPADLLENWTEAKRAYLHDLKFLKAITQAVFMFIIIRLALGLFGMDLYEIYWWFALGLTISLYNMNNQILMIFKEQSV